MATLTIAKARRWRIALPVIATALTAALVTWVELDLPMWSYSSPHGGYEMNAGSLAYGVILAICVLLAAWATGKARSIATLTAVVWACSIGAWVDTADSWAWRLTGNSRELATTSTAAALAIMGTGTALAIGWMTRSRRVVFESLAATASMIGLLYASELAIRGIQSWGRALWIALWCSQLSVLCWNVANGIVLGRFILADSRRRTSGLCPRCAYSLAGLAPNSPCPECGHAARRAAGS